MCGSGVEKRGVSSCISISCRFAVGRLEPRHQGQSQQDPCPWIQPCLMVLTCIVQADVTGAYDAIPQGKLVEVVANMIRHSESTYCIRQYAVVRRDSQGQVHKSFRRQVRP